MDKLLWVLLPIVLAAAAVAVLAWRGRLPPRPVLNVAFSLLLLVYLLVTAGLGIFWVANQHLPVFDWHYVFGYALLVLVVVHLGFNLRAVVSHLRRRPAAGVASAARGRRPLLGVFGVLGLVVAAGGGYFSGLRHGRTELRVDVAPGPGAAASEPAARALAVVEHFHGFSSHTRAGVLRRAAGADWGDPPPPFKTARLGGGTSLPLPAARRALAPGRRLDAAALADLLWHTAGVSARSGGIHFRTSPSSGALFATELYVIALDIPGVPAGAWHYDVPAQALLALAGPGAAGSLPGIGALPPDSRALVVATAVFRRSGHKYRDRTYRYVLGDLGHALENLRRVAGVSAARATLLQAFDEARVAAALGIDEREEGVLAAVLLQDVGAAPLPALAAAAWQPAPWAENTAAALGLTHAIHRATSLHAVALPPCGHTASAGPGAVRPASWQALPPAASHVVDPLAVIARRRSVRRYDATAIALDGLSAVLATMARPGPLLSAAVRIDVLAIRVDGLAAGAWRYHPGAHALEPRVRHLEGLSHRARAAGLDQDVIGNAGAVFVLSIDRGAFAADPAGGARGYRHAYIEAGLVGERVYLEAGARGLGVCAVGAFYDDEMAALVGTDVHREWVVHLAAVGVPS